MRQPGPGMVSGSSRPRAWTGPQRVRSRSDRVERRPLPLLPEPVRSPREPGEPVPAGGGPAAGRRRCGHDDAGIIRAAAAGKRMRGPTCGPVHPRVEERVGAGPVVTALRRPAFGCRLAMTKTCPAVFHDADDRLQIPTIGWLDCRDSPRNPVSGSAMIRPSTWRSEGNVRSCTQPVRSRSPLTRN